MIGDLVAFFEEPLTQRADLVGLVMGGFSRVNHVEFPVLEAEFTPRNVFDFGIFLPEELYMRDFSATQRQFSFMRSYGRLLKSTGSGMTWTIGSDPSQAYDSDAYSDIVVIPYDMYNRDFMDNARLSDFQSYLKNGASVPFEDYIFLSSLARGSVQVEERGGVSDDAWFVQGIASSGLVFFEHFDRTANMSRISVAHIDDKTIELLHDVSETTSHTHLRVAEVHVDSPLSVFPGEDEEYPHHRVIRGCVALWLETAAQLELDMEGVPVSTGSVQDVGLGTNAVALHAVSFPDRVRKTIRIARVLYGSYNDLRDIIVTESDIFALVASRPGGGDPLSYQIRVLPLASVADDSVLFFDLEETSSTVPLAFGSASLHSVQYWRLNSPSSQTADYLAWTYADTLPADLRLSSLVYSYANSTEVGFIAQLCLAAESTESNEVVGSYIYRDIVVYGMRDTVTGQGSHHLIDLNKDNDVAYDLVDIFPLLGEFAWDDDNDLVANAGDILDVSEYECAMAVDVGDGMFERGGCWDDNNILYMVWCLYVIILCAAAYHGARKYRRETSVYKLQQSIERASEHGQDVFGLDDGDDQEMSVYDIGETATSSRASVGASTKSTSSIDSKQASVRSVPKFDAVRVKDPSSEEQFVANVKAVDAALRREADTGTTSNWTTGILILDVIMIVLALVSVILAVVPFYPAVPVGARALSILTWVDFFTSTTFGVDLITRIYVRDRDVFPTVLSYLKKYWYDVPSLVGDVPLAYSVGAVQFTVVTRLFRILRLLRFLRIFRAIRLYSLLARQGIFATIIAKRPSLFLSAIIGVVAVIGGVSLKVVEQNAQPVFEDLGTALWVVMSTVSGIGYGDITPITGWGRFVAVILMGVGVMMIGTVAGSLSKQLSFIGDVSDAVNRALEDRKDLAVAFRSAQERLMPALNPLLSVFSTSLVSDGEFVSIDVRDISEGFTEGSMWGGRGAAGGEADGVSGSARHDVPGHQVHPPTPTVGGVAATSSADGPSTLPPTSLRSGSYVGSPNPSQQQVGSAHLNLAVSMPRTRSGYRMGDAGMVEQFTVSEMDPWLSANRNNAERARGLLQSVLDTWSNKLTPEVQLMFILRRFGLDDVSTGSRNFPRLVAELTTVLFEPYKTNEGYLERVHSLKHHLSKSANVKEYASLIDYDDPLLPRLRALGDVLARFGVHTRPNFFEIRNHLDLLVYQWDRVQNAQWSVIHLRYVSGVEIATPVLSTKEGVVPPDMDVAVSDGEFVASSASPPTPRQTNTVGLHSGSSRTGSTMLLAPLSRAGSGVYSRRSSARSRRTSGYLSELDKERGASASGSTFAQSALAGLAGMAGLTIGGGGATSSLDYVSSRSRNDLSRRGSARFAPPQRRSTMKVGQSGESSVSTGGAPAVGRSDDGAGMLTVTDEARSRASMLFPRRSSMSVFGGEGDLPPQASAPSAPAVAESKLSKVLQVPGAE